MFSTHIASSVGIATVSSRSGFKDLISAVIFILFFLLFEDFV